MQNQNVITRFGLIRHAQTVWNQKKKIQGHSDSPLTTEGQRQAIGWGQGLKRFSWSRILTSDTGRALATAERINAFLKVPLTTDARLREQDWIDRAGKCRLEFLSAGRRTPPQRVKKKPAGIAGRCRPISR